jgi:uncharacterized protein
VIVVSNTSPITNLAAIGQLDLLRQLYQTVIISEAVYRELTAHGGRYPGAVVKNVNWIEVRKVANSAAVTALRLELDEGEAATIVLAQEISADLVLMDERLGRAAALRFGLQVIGVLGVLVEAKQQSLVPNIKPLVDNLINSGFFIKTDLYNRVLQAVGE